MYFLVIKQLIIMLIIAVSGFAVTKAFKWGKAEQQFTSKLLLMVVNPCMILNRFNIEFTSQKLKGFLIAGAFAIVIHFVMIGISLLVCRSKSEQGKALDSIDRIAAVFTNCGFVGIPLINGVLGEDGVFYLITYVTFFNVFLWTFGYLMMAGRPKFLKIITNPNILAVLIGLVIFRLPFVLPEILGKPVSYIAGMNTPVAMLLLGMLFATFKKQSDENYTVRVIKLCAVRHVVMCVFVLIFVLLAMKLFSNVEQIRIICYTMYIAALCPVGMSVSSFAVLFKKDESYSALLCLATSALCVVTLPLSVALLEFVEKLLF